MTERRDEDERRRADEAADTDGKSAGETPGEGVGSAPDWVGRTPPSKGAPPGGARYDGGDFRDFSSEK